MKNLILVGTLLGASACAVEASTPDATLATSELDVMLSECWDACASAYIVCMDICPGFCSHCVRNYHDCMRECDERCTLDSCNY